MDFFPFLRKLGSTSSKPPPTTASRNRDELLRAAYTECERFDLPSDILSDFVDVMSIPSPALNEAKLDRVDEGGFAVLMASGLCHVVLFPSMASSMTPTPNSFSSFAESSLQLPPQVKPLRAEEIRRRFSTFECTVTTGLDKAHRSSWRMEAAGPLLFFWEVEQPLERLRFFPLADVGKLLQGTAKPVSLPLSLLRGQQQRIHRAAAAADGYDVSLFIFTTDNCIYCCFWDLGKKDISFDTPTRCVRTRCDKSDKDNALIAMFSATHVAICLGFKTYDSISGFPFIRFWIENPRNETSLNHPTSIEATPKSIVSYMRVAKNLSSSESLGMTRMLLAAADASVYLVKLSSSKSAVEPMLLVNGPNIGIPVGPPDSVKLHAIPGYEGFVLIAGQCTCAVLEFARMESLLRPCEPHIVSRFPTDLAKDFSKEQGIYNLSTLQFVVLPTVGMLSKSICTLPVILAALQPAAVRNAVSSRCFCEFDMLHPNSAESGDRSLNNSFGSTIWPAERKKTARSARTLSADSMNEDLQFLSSMRRTTCWHPPAFKNCTSQPKLLSLQPELRCFLEWCNTRDGPCLFLHIGGSSAVPLKQAEDIFWFSTVQVRV